MLHHQHAHVDCDISTGRLFITDFNNHRLLSPRRLGTCHLHRPTRPHPNNFLFFFKFYFIFL
nr:protein F23F12.2 [imported] - Caenorhabditis elegans [Caenorhabditis elegans]